MLELCNGKHYIGCTVNVKERFTQHSKGYVPATKPHLPVKLLWCCSFPDRYRACVGLRYMKSACLFSSISLILLKFAARAYIIRTQIRSACRCEVVENL
ncbi:MAG: hypothetical protein KF744_16045 [Taibaiella sp.]|nr:hypothetical protein [Taibaiella sp.]